MAIVEFNFGALIGLNAMLPGNNGGTAGLPAGIPGAAGLYIILNQRNNPHNRYMGISGNIRERFTSRQASCFELGLRQADVTNIGAFCGVLRFKSGISAAGAAALPAPAIAALGGAPAVAGMVAATAAAGWTNPAGYLAANCTIALDGNNYDFENLFIKSVQHCWPTGTVTNTLKVGALQNSGTRPIDVTFNWTGGTQSVRLLPGATWN